MAKQSRQQVFGGDKDPIDIVGESAVVAEKRLLSFLAVIEKLSAELAGIQKYSKSMSGLTGVSTGSNLGDLEKSNSLHKQAITILEQETKVRKSLEISKKEQLAAEQALQRQREQGIKQMDREAAKAAEAARPYKQLEKSLSDARRAYQDMAAAGLSNTKEAREQLKVVNDLRTRYEGLNRTIGNGHPFVGQYEQALNKLKIGFRGIIGVASQFGVTLGAFSIAKSLADTEIRLKSLRLALQNVITDQDDYTNSLRFLSNLSKDYGQDLVVLTSTYKNFIASAQASKLPLEEQNRIYESVVKAGSSLALSNEEIEGSLLAVSQMFSKGTVSAEELRGQLGERLPGAFGLMAKALNVSEAELGKMLQKGEVLAKDALPLLATELEKTYGAKAQENLKTIGGAWNAASTRISEYISGVNSASSVTEKIASVISFFGENIGTVVSALGHLLLLLTVYKTRMIALNVVNKLFGDSLNNNNRSFKNFIGNLQQATDATSKMGKALRSIAWVAVIAYATELGLAFYNIASGASQAATDIERLSKATARGRETAEDRLDKLRESRDKELLRLQKLKNEGKITESQLIAGNRKAEKQYFDEVKRYSDITTKSQRTNYKNYQDAVSQLDKLKKSYGDTYFEILRTTGAALREGGLAGSATEAQIDDVTKENARNVDALIQRISVLKAQQGEVGERGKTYISELKDLNKASIEEASTLKKKAEAIEDYTNRVRDLYNEQIENEERRERNILETRLNQELAAIKSNGIKAAELRIELENKYQQDVLKLERTFRIKRLEEELEYWESVKEAQQSAKSDFESEVEEEFDAQLSLIQRTEKARELELLKSQASEEDINTQRVENQAESLNKQINLYKAYGKDTLDLEIQLAELRNSVEKKEADESIEIEKKRQKELADLRKKGIDALLKELQRASEEREKQIDSEITASQKLEDQLAKAAESGTDSAKESLAAQREVTAQKLDQKREEQRRQEAIARIQAGYEIFEAFLSRGDSVPAATTKTGVALNVLRRLFGSGFFEGTDDTGKKGVLRDQHGTITGYTHENELVMSKADRAKTGNKTRQQLIEASHWYDTFRVNDMLRNNAIEQSVNRTDVTHSPILAAQLKKLDVIANKLDNIPSEFFSKEVVDDFLRVVHTRKSGNETHRTFHNV